MILILTHLQTLPLADSFLTHQYDRFFISSWFWVGQNSSQRKKKINPNGSQKGFWVSINWHVSIFAKRKASLDSQRRIWCKFGVKQRSFYLLIICMHVRVGCKFGVRRSKAHLCVCRPQCSVRITFRYSTAFIILWYQIRNNFCSLSIIFSWHFWEGKKVIMVMNLSQGNTCPAGTSVRFMSFDRLNWARNDGGLWGDSTLLHLHFKSQSSSCSHGGH